jgi:Tfp pilus assembly protein PilZ
MTIATLAHGARQSLARGLEALQAADVPADLFDVARPVARAMGALIDLESSPPALASERVEPALEALREGLRLLQLPEHVDHPAAERGMAAVAETLGAVVELARHLEAGAAPSAVRSRARTLTPAQTRLELAQLERASMVDPMASAEHVSTRRDVVLDPSLRAVDAPLGASGASNFYASLSGGDVVTSGGLFVATDDAFAIGERVLLQIHMPGGQRFVAKGVVAWTRCLADSVSASEGPEATAGFGARFTEVAADGLALIRRYVKNRPPLLHEES